MEINNLSKEKILSINDRDADSISLDLPYQNNLKAYKLRFLLMILFIILLLTLLMLERIFQNMIETAELELLLSIQQGLKSKFSLYYSNYNDFYTIMGLIGEFHIYFLICSHILISIYVGIDAFIALKIAVLHIIGCFLIVLISFAYGNARPFWLDRNIITFFCAPSYGNPGMFTFSSLFLCSYMYKCFKDKEKEIVLITPANIEESVDNESFIIEKNQNLRGQRVVKFLIFVICGIFSVVFFFRYILGYGFLANYALSFIYFIIFFGLVLIGDDLIAKNIKESTILKNYAKRKVFVWLISILVIEGLCFFLFYFYISEDKNSTKQIENFINCEVWNSNQKLIQELPYNIMFGQEPTFQETTILFALLGVIFGSNKCFQTLPTINWYKGSKFLRVIRILVANLFLIPSWFLIINQDNLERDRKIVKIGLSNYLINSFHFFLLYYFLFGILPAYIFKHLRILNHDFKLSTVISR